MLTESLCHVLFSRYFRYNENTRTAVKFFRQTENLEYHMQTLIILPVHDFLCFLRYYLLLIFILRINIYLPVSQTRGTTTEIN